MSDGTLSVRRKQAKPSETAAGEFEIPLAALKAGTFDSFLGMLPNIGQGHVKPKGKSKPIGDMDEFRIEARRKKKLREYDKLLKSFKYSAALDSILRKVRTRPSLYRSRSSHLVSSRPRSKSHQQRNSRSFRS
jgi:U3 small nucleolar RNA-associated protein 15